MNEGNRFKRFHKTSPFPQAIVALSRGMSRTEREAEERLQEVEEEQEWGEGMGQRERELIEQAFRELDISGRITPAD